MKPYLETIMPEATKKKAAPAAKVSGIEDILKAYDDFAKQTKEEISAKMKELKSNNDDEPRTCRHYAIKIITERFAKASKYMPRP